MSYKNRITYYRDGATAKLNNRRVTTMDDEKESAFALYLMLKHFFKD